MKFAIIDIKKIDVTNKKKNKRILSAVSSLPNNAPSIIKKIKAIIDNTIPQSYNFQNSIVTPK